MTAGGAETRCSVVGAGPGGLLLAFLLARAGIDVTLLEAQRDFDRDFRGDTIHPSTLELLDQLGLGERLHALPHRKVPALQLFTPDGVQTVVTFSRLRTPFPYVMLMPQARFLEFIATEASRLPHFHLVTGATVQRLLDDGGAVRGVVYTTDRGEHGLRAALTVAADGRFSRLRRAAGVTARPQSPPMDVLWARLPRDPTDPADEAAVIVGGGRAIVLLGRVDEWQIGCVGRGGSYQQLKAQGLEAFHAILSSRVPWLAGRVSRIDDWRQVNVLSVAADRLDTWHRPGLLFIGDAAHTMLPVAGVGINCAIADAVEAVNVLAGPLRRGAVDERVLHAVQRRRELPTKMIQGFQRLAQRQIIGQALTPGQRFRLPLGLRIARRVPLLRDVPGRMVGLGLRRTRLTEEAVT